MCPALGARMRSFLCALCLVTTGCATSFDFVPVRQPDLAQSGRALVSAERSKVHTDAGDVKVDAQSMFKARGPDGIEKGPFPLRAAALDCRTSADCALTRPADYKISVVRRRVDGEKVEQVVAGTLVVAALSGLVAEHAVCFSDPTCQDSARAGLVVTDVAIGVVAIGMAGLLVFWGAVMHGLAN
jgi:hypothetical protein